jgi:hypothetical protein
MYDELWEVEISMAVAVWVAVDDIFALVVRKRRAFEIDERAPNRQAEWKTSRGIWPSAYVLG